MAYIYKIINDINKKVYVGKTEFSIEKRFKEHCNDAMKDGTKNRPLYSAMRKYGIEHFHIELIEETDKLEEREVYWIEQEGSFKYGYNATIGGDGKRYLDYDLIISTYAEIQNITETARLLNISADSVSNVLKSYNVKIKSSYDILREKNRKPIKMCSKSGEIIKIFPSLKDGADYLINNHISYGSDDSTRHHISDVCQGKRKTAYGYIWEFLN